MELSDDRWLREIMGKPVFRVSALDLPADESIHDVSEQAIQLTKHRSQYANAMYYAKVDTTDISRVRWLSVAGFYVVDVNTTLSLTPSMAAQNLQASVTSVRVFHPRDTDATLTIAETCFTYSRFHLDPLIPNHIANAIKREWVRSYIRGDRGDELLVAFRDDRPVGFLAVIGENASGVRTTTIDLLGVEPTVRRRGIGSALTDFFIQKYGSESDTLQVGTQLANQPSMQLYTKLGFSCLRSQYVLHSHVS